MGEEDGAQQPAGELRGLLLMVLIDAERRRELRGGIGRRDRSGKGEQRGEHLGCAWSAWEQ